MKSIFNSKDYFLLICLALLTIFIFTSHASAQDSIKKAQSSTIKIKISKDENGKKTDYDTTFTTNNKMDSKELNEMISKWERRQKRFDGNMKDMDKKMKELTIELNDLDLPDSAMSDSIKNMTKKMIIMGMGKEHPDFFYHFDPDESEYEYNIETPEPPEPPEPPDMDNRHKEMRKHFKFRNSPMPPRFREFENDEGGLMPLLRGIPLDRVKNFSIKERRHGTRIIIDVDRSPVFNSPRPRQETIIITTPEGNEHKGKPQRIEKRVIIKDDDTKKDKL